MCPRTSAPFSARNTLLKLSEYFDTELFLDPFAGPKFANYLFAAHENAGNEFDSEAAHHQIEEAQLFIEAVHTCYNKIRTEGLGDAA